MTYGAFSIGSYNGDSQSILLGPVRSRELSKFNQSLSKLFGSELTILLRVDPLLQVLIQSHESLLLLLLLVERSITL